MPYPTKREIRSSDHALLRARTHSLARHARRVTSAAHRGGFFMPQAELTTMPTLTTRDNVAPGLVDGALDVRGGGPGGLDGASPPRAPALSLPDVRSRDRVLLYGPPGAGKSTLARELAAAGYTHLEREMFPSDASFVAAVEQCDDDRVVVVRCCFSQRELDRWSRLVGGRVERVDPGLGVAVRRVAARGRAGWRGEVAAAREWYAMDLVEGALGRASREW